MGSACSGRAPPWPSSSSRSRSAFWQARSISAWGPCSSRPARASDIPGVSTSLSPTEEAILWEIRVPRVVLAALVGAMLALAGATYQGVFRNPLGGSVSARRRRRRGARRDDRDRLPPGRAAGAADAPRRRFRGRLRRGDADLRGRPFGATRARRRDTRSSPASRSRPSSRPGRPSSSSRTRRRCRRSTRGSSGTSRAVAGRTSFSSFRMSPSRRS